MFMNWSLGTFFKLFPPATVFITTDFIWIIKISIFTETWIILS